MNIKFKTLSYYPYSIMGRLKFCFENKKEGYTTLTSLKHIYEKTYEDVIVYTYQEKMYTILAKEQNNDNN